MHSGMRPDNGSESFGPFLVEDADHGGRDVIDGTGCINGDDRTGLGVTRLPLGLHELIERGGDAVVKVVVGSLDPIARASAVGTSQCSAHGQTEQHRKIGHETAGRKSVGPYHFVVCKATAGDLIRVRRKKKAVGDDESAGLQGRAGNPRPVFGA